MGAASDAAAPGDEAVNQQEQEGADDCRDETGTLVVGSIPAKCAADPSRDERAGNAQEDRDDAPAGVATRHQQLGDRSGQAAYYDPADDPVILHRNSPLLWRS